MPEPEPERLAEIRADLETGRDLSAEQQWWLLDHYRDAVRAWRHTVTEREELRGLLGRLEWRGGSGYDGDVYCPACGEYPEVQGGKGHDPNCELAKAIGRLRVPG